MEQRSQAQFEYLMATGFAFAISIAVLFIVLNFAGRIREIIGGEQSSTPARGVSLPIKEEFKAGFIAGIVTLYLMEHALFLFFYVFVAKKRKELKGEKKRAEEIFGHLEKDKEKRESTF